MNGQRERIDKPVAMTYRGIDTLITARAVQLSGKAQTVTIFPACVVGFAGLETSFMITDWNSYNVYGLTADGLPFGMPWFSFIASPSNSIVTDCLNTTGWMKIS
jgi:hypothetical protein